MTKPFYFLQTKDGRAVGCVLDNEHLVVIGVLDKSGTEVVEEYVVEIGADPGPRFALAVITLGFCTASAMGAALDAIGKGRSRGTLEDDESGECFDILTGLAHAISAKRAENRAPS